MAGATATAKRAKEYPNPKDTGPMVEFFLPYQQFMDQSKRYTIDVTVNGYPFSAEFGKTNVLPKDVVSVLKNSRSAIHPMANAHQVAGALGGQGRPQSELMQSTQKMEYLNDYQVVQEKEL